MGTKGDALLAQDFNVPIINILWQLVAGSRFSKDDPEEMKLVESVNEEFKQGVKVPLYPLSLSRTFPRLTGYEERVSLIDNQKDYFKKTIREHKETLNENHPRDFIDVYLNE